MKRISGYPPPRKAWHILPRTWASMMLQNGCDVETLRVLGNWKDYQMPLWYSEASGAERRKEALEQIPDLKKACGRNLPETAKKLEKYIVDKIILFWGISWT